MAYLNGHEILFGVVGQVQYDPIYQGNLPLDFFSVGGNLSDWTIYGNSEGVGEETKNLLEITSESKIISEVTFTVDKQAGTITANKENITAATAAINYQIYLPPGDYIFTCDDDAQRDVTYDSYIRVSNTTIARDNNNDAPGNSFTWSGGNVTVYHRIQRNYTENEHTFKPMIRKADTTSNFIPYGYQVPLDIRSENNEKHMDIYIGDSKLYEGQSVSKSSTGIEIEVGRGQNVIDTTLENKPEMSVVPDTYAKLKQIAMNSNGSYNETQSDFIIDNVEEVTQ